MKTCKNLVRREDNWKKYPYLFNECKNLVFECQCGKKYESFPGLYLHFQRKHGQKISTKFNHKECQMTRQDEKIIYRYMFEEKRDSQDHQICAETTFSERQHISNVLSKFTQDHSNRGLKLPVAANQQENKDFIQEIMAEFQSYIFEAIEGQSKKQATKNVLYQIPLHLNSFVQKKQIGSGSTGYAQICIILFDLAQWLRRNEYTDLIIQYVDHDIVQF